MGNTNRSHAAGVPAGSSNDPDLGATLVKLILLWTLLVPITATIVVIRNDWPSKVYEGEHWLGNVASWLVVVGHGLGAILLGAVGYPLVATAWALFAAFLAARRTAAGIWAAPLTWRDLWGRLREVPSGLLTLGLVPVVAVLATIEAPLNLSAVPRMIGWAAPLAIIAVFVWAGVIQGRAHARQVHFFQSHLLALSAVFGVAASTVEGQIWIHPHDGGVVIAPVPAAYAAKRDDPTVEERLAQVLPHLTIDHDASTPERIWLPTATPEDLARRAALAASGGLLSGEREYLDGDDSVNLTLDESDLL